MATPVTAKDAVKTAMDYYQFITGSYGIRFFPEEVELVPEENEWQVVLSFSEDQFSTDKFKQYKVFRVGANSGEVYSMKNWNPPF